MNKILILYAHPSSQFSKINALFKKEAEKLDQVTVHDLYSTYPNFLFDIEREQALLVEHEIILFQHPFYWYSTPAILKEWQDIVLQPGFAYSRGGRALHGKYFSSCISAGGSLNNYSPESHNQRPLYDYLLPIRQMAILCGMFYLEPFIAYGMHRGLSDEQRQKEVERYQAWLEALTQNQLPEILDQPIKKGE